MISGNQMLWMFSVYVTSPKSCSTLDCKIEFDDEPLQIPEAELLDLLPPGIPAGGMGGDIGGDGGVAAGAVYDGPGSPLVHLSPPNIGTQSLFSKFIKMKCAHTKHYSSMLLCILYLTK